MRLAWLGLLLVCGCQTEITFHNQVPGASVENVRWVAGDGTVYTPPSGDSLEPGQSSEPVTISSQHDDDTGYIQFELIVEGRKVALRTDRSFSASSGENTDFDISPETTARNPIASEDSE